MDFVNHIMVNNISYWYSVLEYICIFFILKIYILIYSSINSSKFALLYIDWHYAMVEFNFDSETLEYKQLTFPYDTINVKIICIG